MHIHFSNFKQFFYLWAEKILEERSQSQPFVAAASPAGSLSNHLDHFADGAAEISLKDTPRDLDTPGDFVGAPGDVPGDGGTQQGSQPPSHLYIPTPNAVRMIGSTEIRQRMRRSQTSVPVVNLDETKDPFRSQELQASSPNSMSCHLMGPHLQPSPVSESFVPFLTSPSHSEPAGATSPQSITMETELSSFPRPSTGIGVAEGPMPPKTSLRASGSVSTTYSSGQSKGGIEIRGVVGMLLESNRVRACRDPGPNSYNYSTFQLDSLNVRTCVHVIVCRTTYVTYTRYRMYSCLKLKRIQLWDVKQFDVVVIWNNSKFRTIGTIFFPRRYRRWTGRRIGRFGVAGWWRCDSGGGRGSPERIGPIATVERGTKV